MKKITLYILTLFTLNISIAQITLTQNDMTVIGQVNKFKSNYSSGVGPSPGNGGANQTWDFSSEVYSTEENIGVLHPDSVENGSYFVGTNQVYVPLPYYKGSMSSPISAINDSATEIKFLGILPYNSPCLSCAEVSWENGYTLLDFPTTYQSSFNDKLTLSYTTSSSVRNRNTKTYLKTEGLIDGYGIVKTKGGTYSCLRQIFIQYSLDSIFVRSVLDTVILDTLKTYKWWAKGIGMPVFEIQLPNKSNPSTYSRYYENSSVTAILNEGYTSEVSIFPNPARDFVNITMQTSSIHSYSIKLYDTLGKIILSKHISDIEGFDTSELNSGIYFLAIYIDNDILHQEKLFVVK